MCKQKNIIRPRCYRALTDTFLGHSLVLAFPARVRVRLSMAIRVATARYSDNFLRLLHNSLSRYSSSTV